MAPCSTLRRIAYVLAIWLVAGLAGTLLTGTIAYTWVRHFHPANKQGGILVALVALGFAPVTAIAGAFVAWRAFATRSSLDCPLSGSIV